MQRVVLVGMVLVLAGLACGPAMIGNETEIPLVEVEPDTLPDAESSLEEPPADAAEALPAEPEASDTGGEETAPESSEPLPAVTGNADWQVATGTLGDLPMVYVPGGCFTMGSTDDQIASNIQACNDLYSGAPFPCLEDIYRAEAPAHEVCVEGFWIGQFEVTNAQYAACVEAGVCAPPADSETYGDPAYADHPVIRVPYDQALAFADWAGGTLPTEAEWEFAARGPDSWIYPWGDTFDGSRLNFCDVNCDVYFWVDPSIDDGYAYTAPVGTYPGGASWIGALDLSGNAWEWTRSAFRAYPYDAADGREDPASAEDRVLRGGAYDMSALDLRTALRYQLPADGSCRSYGFRIAAPTDAVEGAP